MRVPWTARRSNQSILKEISPAYSLEGLILKLKLQQFGHLMQRTDSLEKTLMLSYNSLFLLASFGSTFSRFIFSVDKQHLPVWTEPDTNPSPADGRHVRGLTLGSGEGRRCELSLARFMWTRAHFSRLSLPGRLCANILGTSAVTALELQDH